MEKPLLDEEEFLSKFEEPIKYFIKEQKNKKYSKSFKQFLTNYSRGYGLYLTKDLIKNYSMEDNEIPLMSPIYEQINIKEIIEQIMNKFKNKIEKEMKKIDKKQLINSFFKGESLDFIRNGLGFAFISEDTFLMEQSIIVLVISIEAYIKDSFIEILSSDKSLFGIFAKEEEELDQNIRFKIYRNETTVEEEILKNLKIATIHDISDKLHKKLKYTNFFLDKEHKQSIIHTFALRNSFIHKNGIVDQKLKNEIKCRYKIGSKYKIKEEQIINYYTNCFEIIKKFEEWKIKKFSIEQ